MITIKKSKPDCEGIEGFRFGTHSVRLKITSAVIVAQKGTW